MPAIEVARYVASDAAALVAARPEMVRALRARFPGLIQAVLARGDDGEWIDIFVWASREQAEAAVAGEASISEYRAFAQHIREVRFSDVASVAHALTTEHTLDGAAASSGREVER
jgi:hypothetical protein